jgi:hypothetical protein
MEHNVNKSKFNARAIAEVLAEVWQAGLQVLRFGSRTLQRMSWPALLVACLMAAFVLTILPLALTLFAFFLLLKLAIGAFLVGRRQHRDGDGERQQ